MGSAGVGGREIAGGLNEPMAGDDVRSDRAEWAAAEGLVIGHAGG